MTEQILESISFSLQKIINQCLENKISLKDARNDTIEAMNVILNERSDCVREDYVIDLMKQTTKTLSSENLILLVDELMKLCDKLRKMREEIMSDYSLENWMKEIKRRIEDDSKFASELMVKTEMAYSKRIEIFNSYVINEITCTKDTDKREIIELIRKLTIILFLPIHTKNSSHNENCIRILMYCNHSGKAKQSCKGRDCKYQAVLTLGFDGKNSIAERGGTHNHPLDYNFVISKTPPLLKSERKLIPKTDDGLKTFIKEHPNIKLTLQKFRQIQRTDDKTDYTENKFLTNTYLENSTYVKLTNTFSNGCIHSILFIHKRVAEMDYSKRRWYIDDTANTNVYNKNLLAIIVKNDDSFNQLLAFAFLYDQTQSSFELILNQLHNILKYKPDVIICDRWTAQYNSLSTIFTTSKIFFCRLHIERCLLKYFKPKETVMKMYYLMINMKLSEKDFLKAWKRIVTSNIKKASELEKEDENGVEEESEEREVEEEEKNELLEPDTSDIVTMEKYNITISENIAQLLESAKNVNIKKGVVCLADLLQHKTNWLPSECVKYGLYRDVTTNRVEGFFGSLKKLIKHERLTFSSLTDNIFVLANTMFNNVTSVELCDGIVDKSNPLFNSLTEYAKKVLNSQYKLLENYEEIDDDQYCASCHTRKENPQLAWPCYHLMKERKTQGSKKYLLEYDDLPSLAFKSKSKRINWSNQSVTNLTLPDNYELKENVVINKIEHNTNCHPRKKTEFRKRKSNEASLSEIAPFKEKRKPRKSKRKTEEPKIINVEEEIDVIKPPNVNEIIEEEMNVGNDIEEEINVEDNTEEEINVEDSTEQEIDNEDDNEKEKSMDICYDISSIQSPTNETIVYDTSKYDTLLTIEKFEKVMNTFNIPDNYLLSSVLTRTGKYRLPTNIQEKKTIIFPYKYKNYYGVIAYVDKCTINDKQRNNCILQLNDGRTNYPSFLDKIINLRKELMRSFKLAERIFIHTIHLKNEIGQFTEMRYNGYVILYLIEILLKERMNETNDLKGYISEEKIFNSFKRYKELIEKEN